MLVKLTNDVRDYAWGSYTLMHDRLALAATGKPMAEVWFGTHPQSEARTVPENLELSRALGRQLPFMMKFLAADYPLSIQLHPNEQQAAQGFDAENAQHVDLASDVRNFRDMQAKREALVAITDFDILVGFEPAEFIAERLQALASVVSPTSSNLLHRYVSALLGQAGHRAFIDVIFATDDRSEAQRALLLELSQLTPETLASQPQELSLFCELGSRFGADRGLLLAIAMKRFMLKSGEAMFVEAGVAHCYLSGLGVEIMNSSDNVLRGGLTQKHVSANNFVSMLDVAASMHAQPASKTQLLKGLDRYNFATDDFVLHRVEVSSHNLLVDFGLPGESLLLCVDGELAVSNSFDERLVLRRGEAAYLSGDANFYSISGSGSGYLGS